MDCTNGWMIMIVSDLLDVVVPLVVGGLLVLSGYRAAQRKQ
jgi:hypothetical protein